MALGPTSTLQSKPFHDEHYGPSTKPPLSHARRLSGTTVHAVNCTSLAMYSFYPNMSTTRIQRNFLSLSDALTQKVQSRKRGIVPDGVFRQHIECIRLISPRTAISQSASNPTRPISCYHGPEARRPASMLLPLGSNIPAYCITTLQ